MLLTSASLFRPVSRPRSQSRSRSVSRLGT